MTRRWVMNPPRLRTNAWFILLLTVPSLFGQGTLETIRNPSSRQSSSAPPIPRDFEEHHNQTPLGTGGETVSIDLETATASSALAAWVLSLPFTVPQMIFEDNGTSGSFVKYPFARAHDGNMVINPLQGERVESSHLRLRLDYGDNFRDQQKISTHFLFESRNRLGVDTSFDYLRERISPGDHDQLWLGDVNLVWRFAQSERAQMRVGLGMNWLCDPVGSQEGINFTYGGDFYLKESRVVSADLDWGRLGRVGLFRFRTTYGRQIGRTKLYLGHEYLSVGDFQHHYFITGLSFDF